MARARSPNRDKAFEIYKNYDGSITNREIADMLSIYTCYICKCCKKEFVLLSEDVEVMQGYLVCPCCSSRNIKKQKIADNLKECMQERSYIRVYEVLRQR